jgi:hypothetical protein
MCALIGFVKLVAVLPLFAANRHVGLGDNVRVETDRFASKIKRGCT